MKERDLAPLLREPASLELLNKLQQLAENASETAKQHLIERAITECQVGITVNTPVNGFILYVLCLDKAVSAKLLVQYWYLIKPAVVRHWTVPIKKLGEKSALDPAVRDLAMRTYSEFVKLTKKS